MSNNFWDTNLILKTRRGSIAYGTNISEKLAKELNKRHGKEIFHAIRLLCMGIQILNENDLDVLRPERAELMDIRTGKYDFDWVKERVSYLEKRLDDAYDRSTISHKPDREAIAMLCEDIYHEFWRA